MNIQTLILSVVCFNNDDSFNSANLLYLKTFWKSFVIPLELKLMCHKKIYALYTHPNKMYEDLCRGIILFKAKNCTNLGQH